MRLLPGCFGKIPIHGDFVRHNALAPEVGLLDDWIQAGILSSRQALGGAWDASFEKARPQRFLFHPVPGGRVLAGVMVPSQDKPGRRFPFLVFAAVDVSAMGLQPTLVPAALSAFFERAEREASSGWKGLDLKGFLARFGDLSAQLDAEGARKSVMTLGAPGTGAALWQRLFGSAQDPRRYLLIHNLVETLRLGTAPRYALRFPGVSGEPEVALWLEVGRRVGSRTGLPTLTVWRVGPDGGPTVVYDALKAAYFLPLWWPDRKSDLLFPLAAPVEGPDPRLQQARERYATLLEDPSMRLSALLNALAG